jgi:GNAT superfamily N-acetyltransferase
MYRNLALISPISIPGKGRKTYSPVACVHMTIFSDFQVHPSLQRRGIGQKIVDKITR